VKALVMRARAELRLGLRWWLALALRMGVAGGVVLAAMAGGRRTDSAMARLEQSNRAPRLFGPSDVSPSDNAAA
jgi:hypothetical protein